ncbi:MAG TPA: acyl-CoA dehydrogenase family protein, partial [Gaiellaceae bacterium]|nr:acyl-CoA dehydrogenase family protein [Gaiellaceae bacterium]
MSKPVQTINRYKADLREFKFLLFEQFKLDALLGKEPFTSWGVEEVESSINECYRFVREVTGPLNTIGDVQGCTLVDGKVKTPDGFKEAWTKLYEAGWKSIGVDPEYGGAGAPHSVRVVIEELICGSNASFSMYAGLSHGAAEVVEAFGTPEQKALYCERLFSGKWAGTMCLTEEQAGSDVGSARSTAKRNADGTYTIAGTKIFISAGDHDLAENVIHLVLARVDGAPAGTKGLTLFIVPKIRVDAAGKLGKPNDVKVAAIEHKMGINGSSTCVLAFGED